MPKRKQIKHLVISILLLFLSYGLIRSALEVYRGEQRMKDLESEVIGLQNKRKELEESIKYKQTNEYIEEKARNDLNLIKPGESVYVVSGPGSEEYSDKRVLSKTDKREEGPKRKEDSNWYKWYKLFF